MYAVILAGGFGTRLKSVVNDLPKPLAPINGRPFLDYVIQNLKHMGINEIVLCLHYMAEKIRDYYKDGSRLGVRIIYSVEEKPLGTGGALGLLSDLLDNTFCVINADTYMKIDNISDFISEHNKHRATVTMALTSVNDHIRYGQVLMDETKQIKGFVEKGNGIVTVGLVNAGFYLFEPRIFDYIDRDIFVSLEETIFPLMIDSGEKIVGYPEVTDFFDIGIPEDYYSFQQWIGLNTIPLEGDG